MPSASMIGSRSCAERWISSVSSSPGGESNATCSSPELAPLAPAAISFASSRTVSAPRRTSASATAVPTTPPPMTATSCMR